MKERVEVWKRAFEADDHAVRPTLVQFAWNHAAFSTVAELVRLAPDTDRGGKQLNGMTLDLLASTYWASTVMAIRRLVDKGSIGGEKGVYSLRSIVRDARAHRKQLTRRVYMEVVAGLPYDYAAIEKQHWAYVISQPPGLLNIPRELDFDRPKDKHIEFDWLSGVDEADRTEGDLIREEVFDKLEERLRKLDRIADHATIYFAHASSPESREGRGLQNWNLQEARDALRELAQVAEFVGRWFCSSGVGDILPTAQFNQFEFLERPLLTGSTEELEKRWEEFGAEVASWPYIENSDL